MHFAFEFKFEFQRPSKTAHKSNNKNNNNNGRLWLRPRNAQKKNSDALFFLSTESNNKLHSSTGRRRLVTIGGGGSARVWVLLQGRHGGRWVTDASWPYLDAMLCLLIRSKDAAARDGRLVVWLPQRVLHTAAVLHEWRLARPPRCS